MLHSSTGSNYRSLDQLTNGIKIKVNSATYYNGIMPFPSALSATLQRSGTNSAVSHLDSIAITSDPSLLISVLVSGLATKER